MRQPCYFPMLSRLGVLRAAYLRPKRIERLTSCTTLVDQNKRSLISNSIVNSGPIAEFFSSFPNTVRYNQIIGLHSFSTIARAFHSAVAHHPVCGAISCFNRILRRPRITDLWLPQLSLPTFRANVGQMPHDRVAAWLRPLARKFERSQTTSLAIISNFCSGIKE
jgi:hypothetical protein